MNHAVISSSAQRSALSLHRCHVGGSRTGLPGFSRHPGPMRRSVASGAFVELHDAMVASASHLDLSHLSHLPGSLMASLADVSSTVADVVTTTGNAAADPASAAGSAVASATAATGSSNPFDLLANGFESFLTVLDGLLEKIGVPYSYGWAIILLTVLVKVGTFPLSQKQVQSTQALQALQPQVKELQAKYAGDQETIQLETARLYREAGVNPLAGCLPTLATIPVFIGLYRALTMAADDGLLEKGFYWIPSLGGPTSSASRIAGAGFAWLFPLVDGAPPIGWPNALAYLVMPVLLTASQFVSQKVMQPPASSDPQAQQTNAILKFLPLLIGYFSLNVPSGLTLYWFTNNLLSTAQQIYLKQAVNVTPVGFPSNPASSAIIDTTATAVKPKEERVKKVPGKEFSSRRKNDGVIDISASSVDGAGPSSQQASPAQQQSAGQDPRGKKGKKFMALKAREAASKASAQSNGSGGASVASGSTAESSSGSQPDKAESPSSSKQE